MRLKRSISHFFSPLSSENKSSISCKVTKFGSDVEVAEKEITFFTMQRLLLVVWMSVGLAPLLLQTRSYIKFTTPHKITQDLIVPAGSIADTLNREELCPVEGLLIAGAWWNVDVTHYYTIPDGTLCRFVVPQYNIHGSYLLGSDKVAPSSTTPANCSGDSYQFHHYFYHGSVGYYAFYEEASGTYCFKDHTAYVEVNGLGTYDINGSLLARDTGDFTYRRSYWYGLFGAIWITYRSILMRRSYISCLRYGRKCDNMQEKLRLQDVLVYVQESLRLSAHGARNYHRVVLLYLLIEGLMSDLFMLIAQDGFFAKVQYISLGYNLSGVLSMIFEMIESMHWLGEKTRCCIKRLLFNYETALVGEFFCAAAMQYYLTSLNRSSLKGTKGVAEAVSYYAWSLVGHGIIVLGIIAVILSVRAIGALIATQWTFGSLKVFTAPCCIDTTLGVRSKMILLSGYDLEDDNLFYKVETLKAFGLMNMEEEDGTHFLVVHKLHWVSFPRQNMIVIGEVLGRQIQPCNERSCTGIVRMLENSLGGEVK